MNNGFDEDIPNSMAGNLTSGEMGDSGSQPGVRTRSRGGISAFSADGKGNFSRYEIDDNGLMRQTNWSAGSLGTSALMRRAIRDQSAAHSEFSEVDNAARQRNAKQMVDLQNSTASLMKLANNGNGRVSNDAISLFNRKFGGDGVYSGLVSAGYDQNGDFSMNFAQGRDQFGNRRIVTQRATPMMQWQIQNQQLGIFDDNDRGSLRKRLSDSGYSSKELDSVPASIARQMGVRTPSQQTGGMTEKQMFDAENKMASDLFNQKMKYADFLSKQREAIATANPDDSRLKRLDATLERLGSQLNLGVGIGTDDDLANAFGVGGDVSNSSDNPLHAPGERLVNGGKKINQGSWWSGKREVPRLEEEAVETDETILDPETGLEMPTGRKTMRKTGRMLVNTEHELKDGTKQFALTEGVPYYRDNGKVYVLRNGNVFERDAVEGETPIFNEKEGYSSFAKKDGSRLVIPQGKVVQIGNQNYMSDRGNLIPTDKEVSWDEESSEEFLRQKQMEKRDAQKKSSRNGGDDLYELIE